MFTCVNLNCVHVSPFPPYLFLTALLSAAPVLNSMNGRKWVTLPICSDSVFLLTWLLLCFVQRVWIALKTGPKCKSLMQIKSFQTGEWKKSERAARLKFHADTCLFVQLYTCWVSWNFWVHCEVDMSDLKTWRFRFHSDAMTWFYCVTERTTVDVSIELNEYVFH